MPPSASGDLNSRLRALPSVDRIMQARGADPSDRTTLETVRRAIDLARERIRSGAEAPSVEEINRDVDVLLAGRTRRLLNPVINATGVLIHTNLGRVPLGLAQLDAVTRIAGMYSDLEYDVDGGTRGSRYTHARELLMELTGAESALVVNNNAAAVLLVLSALCRDREVIISRGELIEIGGEFRIPDVMETSRAKLVEVGTTNRTHLADYERAIGTQTAALLKVHPSNYQVTGFTSSVSANDLAKLARGRRVLFVHDIGSGLLTGASGSWTEHEPTVERALQDGADLVTFSGDKLLGGPQAGIIIGREVLVKQLAKHPLTRALRVDKMTLAALEATLQAHLEGRASDLPLWKLAGTPLEDLEERARTLADMLNDRLVAAKVEATALLGVAGGGSTPGSEIPSWGLSVVDPERSAAEIARALRALDLPIVCRVEDQRVLLNLISVLPDQDASLGEGLLEILN